MKHKTITVNEFVNKGLENNVTYTIEKEPPLKANFDRWLRNHKLDNYSIRCKLDYMKGITRDLSYKNTIDKCNDKQYIRFISVRGYSEFMELKHPTDIDKEVARKVKKLIADNKVGYLDDDSCGCYLACRKEDYSDLCKYLNVEYDKRDDDKEFYYNSLFDDIRVWFNDYCKANIGVPEKVIYDVIRYITVNIDEYTDILLSAKGWKEDDCSYWLDRLWSKAYNDMKETKQ